MILHRQIVVRGRCLVVAVTVGCGALVAGGSASGAQQRDTSDPHRWAAAVTVDLGTIADDFANQCGGGASPSYGGGLAVLYRPRRWLVATADLRANDTPPGIGCSLNLPAPVQIEPNVYESRLARVEYPHGVPAKPLVRSALHFGVETPGSPLFRATVGAGMIWTGHQTPFATLGIGGGSSNRGVRFYWEFETNLCRVRIRDGYSRYKLDSVTMAATALPSRTVDYVANVRWTALHLGIEAPLAFGR